LSGAVGVSVGVCVVGIRVGYDVGPGAGVAPIELLEVKLPLELLELLAEETVRTGSPPSVKGE
jgi:hypothetical protein